MQIRIVLCPYLFLVYFRFKRRWFVWLYFDVLFLKDIPSESCDLQFQRGSVLFRKFIYTLLFENFGKATRPRLAFFAGVLEFFYRQMTGSSFDVQIRRLNELCFPSSFQKLRKSYINKSVDADALKGATRQHHFQFSNQQSSPFFLRFY